MNDGTRRGLTCGFLDDGSCPRGDLKPHALIRALAPQASASANSATRTSAEGTLATTRPGSHIGSGPQECQDGGMADDTLRDPGHPADDSTYDPSYDPTGEVVDLCRDLIRIDTSNYGDHSGPGERKAAEYVAEKLAEVGLEPQIFESHPGRASTVARIAGEDPSRPALLIHGHTDVVPANAQDWTHDPFSGEVADGCVWGRGAVDMKDMDAMPLAVVRDRLRSGRRPPRDIVLAFLADEEAGGTFGARYLVDHHPDLFEGVTEAISEVGGFSFTVNEQLRLYLIETAQKGMHWMKLTVDGSAGHGSMIHKDNAI